MYNKYNIFWFIVDSVRSFRTGIDDRDWLDVMDEFAKDAVQFTNAFTGAPSSKLAAGAIFSGIPTPFLSRHFNDWEINLDGASSIRSLVENHGYHYYSLLDTRNGRENYQSLVPPIKASLLPGGYRLSDYVWLNRDITHIFNFLLENERILQPCCTTFWYDCRRDPKTSFYVSEAINLIKKSGLYDNSIIILMSDHGYPDPSTKLNENFFRGLGHDMILTDDNIRTPLLIKYPNCPGGKKIDSVVGHIDILPTIFDLLDIPYNHGFTEFQGTTLLPLINGIERFGSRIRRTDTRLPMDVQRMVSLRSNRFKYIFAFDLKNEFFFDLEKDPQEIVNVVDDPDYKKDLVKFKSLKDYFEEEIFSYHKSSLLSNATNSLKSLEKKFKAHSVSVLIVARAQEQLIKILSYCLKKNLNCSVVDLLTPINQDNLEGYIDNVFLVNSISDDEIFKLGLGQYSIVFFLTANSKRVFQKSDIKAAISQVSSDRCIILDYNFMSYDFFSKLFYIPNIKLFFNWSKKSVFYKQEPIYFLKDLTFFCVRLVKRFFKKEKDIDIKAAREIMEYRSYHLSSYKYGLGEMDQNSMQYELKRIKTRE